MSAKLRAAFGDARLTLDSQIAALTTLADRFPKATFSIDNGGVWCSGLTIYGINPEEFAPLANNFSIDVANLFETNSQPRFIGDNYHIMRDSYLTITMTGRVEYTQYETHDNLTKDGVKQPEGFQDTSSRSVFLKGPKLCIGLKEWGDGTMARAKQLIGLMDKSICGQDKKLMLRDIDRANTAITDWRNAWTELAAKQTAALEVQA